MIGAVTELRGRGEASCGGVHHLCRAGGVAGDPGRQCKVHQRHIGPSRSAVHTTHPLQSPPWCPRPVPHTGTPRLALQCVSAPCPIHLSVSADVREANQALWTRDVAMHFGALLTEARSRESKGECSVGRNEVWVCVCVCVGGGGRVGAGGGNL